MAAFSILFFIPSLLMFLFLTTGIVYVLTNWNKHPEPSKLALLGLLVGMVNLLGTPIVNLLVWRIIAVQQMNMLSISILIQFMSSGLQVVSLLLLLVAIYTGRESTNESLVSTPSDDARNPSKQSSENPYEPN